MSRIRMAVMSVVVLMLTLVSAYAVAPVASNQTVTVMENDLTWFNLALTDPDTVVSSANMYTTIVNRPTNGVAQSYSQIYSYAGLRNQMRYTVTNTSYIGPDRFTWYANDNTGGTSAVATVSIMIMANPPVPFGQSLYVGKNEPTTIMPLYTGGLRYTNTVIHRTGYLQGPEHGTLVVTNNTFIYTPSSNYVGSDYFVWHIAYSNVFIPSTNTPDVTCTLTVLPSISTNADWTQWRHDEFRTAQTPATIPDTLYLQWRRDIKTANNPYSAFFNAEYTRPVQLGKTLYVNQVGNDSVAAYDTDTGSNKWCYYASGALRRPPVAVFNRFNSMGMVEVAPLVSLLLLLSLGMFFLLQLATRLLPSMQRGGRETRRTPHG